MEEKKVRTSSTPGIFVIGDIHGALRALQQLLDKISPSPEDQLIFLGDYVDGWSQSKEVIDYLIHLNEKLNCTFIRGNHDTWCEEWLNGAPANNLWVIHGGASTIKSYLHIDEFEKKQHQAFFAGMQNYVIDEENRLFIHAGFSSMHGPSREVFSSNYSWDRTLWETALATNPGLKKTDVFYPKRLNLFEEIFIGHTPTTNYGIAHPMNGANVWNVDTGAGFKGKLSALNILTKEFFQSDPTPGFYPGEIGRNRTL